MPQRIPITNDYPNYTIDVTLDGVEYTLGFRWSERGCSWVCSIALLDGTVLSPGQRVALSVPLFQQLPDLRLPAGILIANDTSNEGAEATEDNFGLTVELLYYTLEELQGFA